ncbi:MAG: hypothetical protein CM15mP21_4920 [Hyphomicrobiales bacterium]|nr:MAG: hypothetical protein CM15mP21_4920 [Hyphomicrobiales bacterium]
MDKGAVADTLAHIELAASLLAAAEMCGGTYSVIDYTLDYLKTRKQFGKLIGGYQSLKHTMVDAHMGYERARAHLYSAAFLFGQQGEGEIPVRMAKAEAEEAFAFAADRAIQFHGGYGFTYDCDAQLYRRRAIWNAALVRRCALSPAQTCRFDVLISDLCALGNQQGIDSQQPAGDDKVECVPTLRRS